MRHEDHRLIQETAGQRSWTQFWHPTGGTGTADRERPAVLVFLVAPRPLRRCGARHMELAGVKNTAAARKSAADRLGDHVDPSQEAD